MNICVRVEDVVHEFINFCVRVEDNSAGIEAVVLSCMNFFSSDR